MAVPRKHGVVVWSEVDFPALRELRSTGTFEISRGQAAGWMRSIPTVSMAWIDSHGGPAAHSSSALSTGCVRAELFMERSEPTGPSDRRRRYYRYLIAQIEDGRWFQAGPDKDLDGELGHHAPERPEWLEDFRRSTSTGW
jgi:hypothetical protein